MRILYLASVRIPSEKASGLAIMRQCEAFASLGHRVTLIRPSRKNSIADDAFSYYGIRAIFSVVSVPVFPLYISLGLFGYALMRITLLCALTFRVWRVRNEVDILYARDPWLLLFPLLFFPRKKMIIEMHSKHSNWVTRFVVSSAGGCIVISEGLRTFYAAMTKRGDIQVEPSGVDVEQFKNIPDSAILRESLGLPKEKVIFGYFGKFTTMGEEKGVTMLVEAFAELFKQYGDTHLLLVGLEDSERLIINSCAEACGLPKEAMTLWSLDPKLFAHHVSASDVLLMNYPDTEHYREYMSPSKLLAYRASGRLILSSDLPSIRSLAEGAVCILFTPGDKDVLVAGYHNAYTRVRAGTVRTSPIDDRYSWRHRGERILVKYQ
jgi:glycosyltransferase involved in cell wall biosynthesis